MKQLLNAVIRLLSKLIGRCGRCAPVLAVVLALVCGCSSSQRYLEGTATQVGALIPYDGSLYGINVVNYLNGVSVQTASNVAFTVSREYASSNAWFGCATTTERSKTEVEVKK